jgi:hypothetical protein
MSPRQPATDADQFALDALSDRIARAVTATLDPDDPWWSWAGARVVLAEIERSHWLIPRAEDHASWDAIRDDDLRPMLVGLSAAVRVQREVIERLEAALGGTS